MNRGDWILLVVGAVAWIWFLWQMFHPYGFFDRVPRLCSGCQRHFLKADCPVHGHEARRRNG